MTVTDMAHNVRAARHKYGTLYRYVTPLTLALLALSPSALAQQLGPLYNGQSSLAVGNGSNNILTLSQGAGSAAATITNSAAAGGLTLTGSGGLTLKGNAATDNVTVTPGTSGAFIVSRGGFQSTKTIVYSGTQGAANQNLRVTGNPSGTATDIGDSPLNLISGGTDNVQNISGGSVELLQMTENYGNTAMGSRNLLNITVNKNNTAATNYGSLWATGTPYTQPQFVHTASGTPGEGNVYQLASTSCTSGATPPSGTGSGISDGGCTWNFLWANVGFAAIRAGVNPTTTEGGLDTSGTGSFGTTFGVNFFDRCKGTATNLTGCTAQENDIQIEAGASAFRKTALQLILEAADVNQGAHVDAGLIIGAQVGTSPGWRNSIEIGDPTSQEPWATGGSLIAAHLGENWATVNPQPTYGLYLADVTFGASNGKSIYVPGMFVDASGGVGVGAGYLQGTTDGLQISAPVELAKTATVSAGGTGCANSDLGDDPNGGLWTVASNTNGVTTAVTELVPSVFNGGSPPSSLSLTFRGASTCSGVTITPTWTASNDNVVLGTGAALATTATKGFALIATMPGLPTGNVGGTGKGAIVIDTTDNKFCWIVGATVKCVLGS